MRGKREKVWTCRVEEGWEIEIERERKCVCENVNLRVCVYETRIKIEK